MTAVFLWLLTWLPHVLPAQLPQPVNLTLNSEHFRTMLKWERGPGTPPGAFYKVDFVTDRETSWVPVPGCEHVQQPLVCNLTSAFSDPHKTYYAQVTTLPKTQKTHDQSTSFSDFRLIRDSRLELPLLNVTICNTNLCVDLQLPKLYMLNMSQNYKDIYNSSLKYKLKINDADILQPLSVQEIMHLKKHIIKNPVVPGKTYCVSICFWDMLESKESNYSLPVCAFTPGLFSADPWILAGLCVLVMFGVAIVACLISAGFIYPIKRPLPPLLTSVPHIEDVLVITSSSMSLSSVLTVKAKLPSTDNRQQTQPSSDESDGESETESTIGVNKLQDGATFLSFSLFSLPLSSPSSPEVKPQSIMSSDQTPNSQKTCSSSAKTHTHTEKDRDTVETTEPDQEENDIVKEEYSQDVNLLTLTFGRHDVEKEDEKEKEEQHLDVGKVGRDTPSLIEECSIPPIQLSKPGDTQVVETISCSIDEEDEWEEEGDSDYMGRPCTAVLQKFL